MDVYMVVAYLRKVPCAVTITFRKRLILFVDTSGA